tara:strand:+ start:356 stop:505 length:150 start_codon:yes stop_codon:yes gene_type:complete
MLKSLEKQFEKKDPELIDTNLIEKSLKQINIPSPKKFYWFKGCRERLSH